ncbi:MAG: hypothetical protein AAGJ79_11665 [Verrucomicrobiota bacterium]
MIQVCRRLSPGILLAPVGALIIALAFSGCDGGKTDGVDFGREGSPGEPTKPQRLYLVEINKVSPVPNPKNAPYADCLSVCHANFVAGDGREEEILLVIPAFLSRMWTQIIYLQAGDTLQADHLVPWTQVPPIIQTMQRSDEIGAFSLPLYYCRQWTEVESPEKLLSADRGVLADELPSAHERSSARRELKVSRSAITKRISATREEIASLLSENGGDWASWEETSRTQRQVWTDRLKETGGFERGPTRYYFEPKLAAGYARNAGMGAEAPSIKTLIALHEELAADGRHLIVLPFPMPEEVSWKYASVAADTPPPGGMVYPSRLRILDTLLKAGIDVVDILPVLLDLPLEELPFYDCPDPHPANGTIVSAAKVMADVLESYGIPREAHSANRSLVTFNVPEHRTLFPKDSSYKALAIEGGTHTYPAEPGIVVVGDSFCNVPKSYGAQHANFLDHLSWELGRRVHWVIVYGGTKQVFQNLRRNHDIYHASSIVIFAFPPSFLTDGRQYEEKAPDSFLYESRKL